MKRIFFVICVVVVISIQNVYGQLKAKVDECFELTSIVFGLAGAPEYGDVRVPSYLEDINKEFSSYALSAPIKYVKSIIRSHKLGYNAVSATASMLEIVNGKVQLRAKYSISDVPKIDSRWDEEIFSEYLKMLNLFYKQSNFNRFYKKHKPLYDLAQKTFDDNFPNLKLEWFESFFGKKFNPNIKILISLSNGPCNYAFTDGIIIGVCADANSVPVFDKSTKMVLMHEIVHHYTSTMFDECWFKMKDAADRIYPFIAGKMAKIAYGSARTSMLEWFNNLCTLMYFKETEDQHFIKEVSINEQLGFIWMWRSVDFMESFYANRDKYKTIEDFISQLIAFLNFTADNFDFIHREYELQTPYIVSVFPISNANICDYREIVIKFSRPMLGSYGFMGIPNNVEALEFDFWNIKWSEDYTQCIIPIFQDKMERGKVYGVKLNPKGFISAKYFPLDEKFIDLVFKP